MNHLLSRLPRRQVVVRAGLVLGTLAISVAILSLLVYRERAVLLNYQWQLRWRFLLGAALLFGLGLVLAAAVWADLMRTLGSRVALADHIRYYGLSQLAKRLPGTVWYVAGRGYLYRQQGESLRLVSVASSLELAVSLIAGALVCLTLAAYWVSTLSRLYVVGLVGVLGLGLAMVHPRTVRWILQRLKLAELPAWGYTSTLKWVGVYASIWAIGGTVIYLVANAIVPVELPNLPYIIGSWSLVGVLSVLVLFLPNNLGFTEVGLSLMLAGVIPSSLAVLVAVAARILLFIYEIVEILLMVLVLAVIRPTTYGVWGNSRTERGPDRLK